MFLAVERPAPAPRTLAFKAKPGDTALRRLWAGERLRKVGNSDVACCSLGVLR
jgi:hypothetical protein